MMVLPELAIRRKPIRGFHHDLAGTACARDAQADNTARKVFRIGRRGILVAVPSSKENIPVTIGG